MAGPQWRRCIERLRILGRVAFFHTGPPDDYVAARRALRRTYPDIPVAWLGEDAPAIFQGLYEIVNATNPDKTPGSGRRAPVVIANRRDLPAHRYRGDFPIHVVGPTASRVAGRRRLLKHESVEAFEQYLWHQFSEGNMGGQT